MQLTDEELDRLPSVINMVPLNFSCGAYRGYVRAGHTPTLDEPGFWNVEGGKQVAAQAIAAFRS